VTVSYNRDFDSDSSSSFCARTVIKHQISTCTSTLEKQSTEFSINTDYRR